jgi:hypothetical protein
MTIERKLNKILTMLKDQQAAVSKKKKKSPTHDDIPEPHKNETYKAYIGRVLRGKTFHTKDGAPKLLTKAASKWNGRI